MKWIFIDIVIVNIEIPNSFNILCDTTVTISGTATPDVPTIWTQVSGNPATILSPNSKTTVISRGTLSGPFVFKLSTLDGRFYKYTTVYTTPTTETTLGGAAPTTSELGIIPSIFVAPQSAGSFDLKSTSVPIGWIAPTNNSKYAKRYYLNKYDRATSSVESVVNTNRGQISPGKTYKITTEFVSPFRTYRQDSQPFSIEDSIDRYTTDETLIGGYSKVVSSFNRLAYNTSSYTVSDTTSLGGYAPIISAFTRYPYTSTYQPPLTDTIFIGGYKLGNSLFSRTSYNGTVLG